MAYELVVGLNVNNEELYSQYRLLISPILKQYEGGFRYDFKIKETLKSEDSNEMNRLFLIYFKNKDSMNLFFSDSNYIKIKNNYFSGAVNSTTIISEYERS